ncbi:hypothetical protein D9753_35590 [Streptomyces dangxiongensis]|uniref:Uncharacterized protein n=1 Tax=Streptomyces dangxiongensis TaxID=1442032 RepID=A0A3G2JQJ9_9ACTN|nr:hypothetical protein D9753_35590 [Streptomyces dangxiongensis]
MESWAVEVGPPSTRYPLMPLPARVAMMPSAATFRTRLSAHERWRAVTAPHLVALVRAGARFEKGHIAERPEVAAA